MKTLYITDLDGTFLGADALPSPFTKEAMARLSEKGVHFTCASARTHLSASRILRDVPLSVPAVLMNGAIIYDIGEKRWINVEFIPEKAYSSAYHQIKAGGLEPFVYCLTDGDFKAYYENLDAECNAMFHSERIGDYGDAFVRAESNAQRKDVFYIVVIGFREDLEKTFAALKKIGGINVEMYASVYSGHYFLEIFSSNASKYTGAMWLREKYGFDRLVGFGDNDNDIALLDACDAKYAVSNAVETLKIRAGEIIGSNKEDAVVKKILELEGLL